MIRDELEYQSREASDVLSELSDSSIHAYHTILLKRHAQKVFKKDKLTVSEMKYIDRIVTDMETKNKLNKLKTIVGKAIRRATCSYD